MLGGVANQAFWVTHFAHDLVTDINAGSTADAGNLQSIANVNAGRTDLHTQGAINTVAKPHGLVVGILFAGATILPALGIVGNNQGVLVEHHTLEAGVGTHVNTDLFAQETCSQVGHYGEETDPEIGPAIGLSGQQVHWQFANRGEVADKGDACAQPDQQPQ